MNIYIVFAVSALARAPYFATEHTRVIVQMPSVGAPCRRRLRVFGPCLISSFIEAFLVKGLCRTRMVAGLAVSRVRIRFRFDDRFSFFEIYMDIGQEHIRCCLRIFFNRHNRSKIHIIAAVRSNIKCLKTCLIILETDHAAHVLL